MLLTGSQLLAGLDPGVGREVGGEGFALRKVLLENPYTVFPLLAETTCCEQIKGIPHKMNNPTVQYSA